MQPQTLLHHPLGSKAGSPGDGAGQEKDVLHRMLRALKCPDFTVTRRLLFPNIFPYGSNSPGNVTSPPGQQDGHNGHRTGRPSMCKVFNRKDLLLGLLMFWWSLLEHKPAFA